MAITLTISIEFEDESDYDFMRTKLIGAVEEKLDENLERMDGQIQVDWE